METNRQQSALNKYEMRIKQSNKSNVKLMKL